MESLKEILDEMFGESVDGVSFLPDKEFNLDIKGFQYTKKSKYEKYDLGHLYHIILYKCDDDGQIINPDHFTAVLTDPSVYVNWIIKSGFYGIVSKKHKTSKTHMNKVFKQIKELSRSMA